MLDITIHNGILYAATTSGLFYLDYKDNIIPFFSPVEKVFSPWTLCSVKFPGIKDRKLLVGTQKGLFEITNNNNAIPLEPVINKIKSRPTGFVYYNIYKISPSKRDSSLLYIGAEELTALSYKNGSWKEEFVIPHHRLNNNDVRSIVEDKYNNLWLATNLQGIIKIDFKGKDTIFHYYTKKDGLPDDYTNFIYWFNNELIFATTKGILRFNYESEKFYPETSWGKNFYDGSKGVFRISQDYTGKYWLSLSDNPDTTKEDVAPRKLWVESINTDENGNLSSDSISFTLLPNLKIEAIYNDTNGITWFGGSKGIYSYNTKIQKNYIQKFYTLIRKVVIGSDSVLFFGTNFNKDSSGQNLISLLQPDELKPELSFRNNNITIHFSCPYFENEEAIVFSYLLEGYEENWSKWNKEHYKDFTNLNEGDYVFKVRAKNIYGIVSETASYAFTILSPWYRTVWAYIAYVILSIVLIVAIVKIYTRRLELEKIRLEKIVKERTAEVVRQKDEIEKKNVTLEQQKQEIESKNVVLEQQKEEITIQRDHIAEINREMTDSIHYAERIQKAILPHDTFAQEILSEYFILFKPKDIVSGDFYWIGKIHQYILATAVDCTGHGVPGAFMSMLGIAFLNEVVKDKDITEAGQVLDNMRIHIIKSLQQTGREGEQKDGMDMSFSAIDINTNKVQWAGANNSLYLIRKKKTDNDILAVHTNKNNIEYKPDLSTEKYNLFEVNPDSMPIAIYLKMNNFTNNIIQLEDGDSLYMFTDGFADQFGGPKGKKFKYKTFKLLLLDNQDPPMIEQKSIYHDTIEAWKSYIDPVTGKIFEQIDDICIIGIRWRI
ncbi:MAG: SpoIIE family protein phosphatase [Bacteroidia bacterium]|nr:SpoIIE family protein phosphatase [Bacteroidia bacterium]